MNVIPIERLAVLVACVAIGGCTSHRHVVSQSSQPISSARGNEARQITAVSEIDPFYFIAGLTANGINWFYNLPPQCESFFREDNETRPAELFLDAARKWNHGVTTHYYDPDGKRLVVLNAPLSNALQAFYSIDVRSDKNDTLDGLLVLERQKRLSFLAGIYARSHSGGEFHGSGPTPAMQTAIFILLAEGCKISNMDYREKMSPIRFISKLSPRNQSNAYLRPWISGSLPMSNG